MSASRGRIRQRDRALEYCVACVAGLAPVFLMPESLWWVPAAVMVVYCAIGLRKAQDAGLELEFADSFYYLGFTFSIGSLLASLHPFGVSGGVSAKDELQFFGLGMMTTLIGVIGRTTMQLFYRTPTESVEAVNQRIHQSAFDFLDQLSALNGQIARMASEAADSATKTSAAAKEAVESHLVQLTQLSQAIGPRINELTQAMTSLPVSMNSLDRVITTLHAQIDEAHRATRGWTEASWIQVEAMTGASERLREINSAGDDLAQTFQSAVAGASTSSAAITDLGRAATSTNRRLQSLGEVAQPIEVSINRASAAIDIATGSLGDAVESLRAAALSVRSQLEAFQASLSPLDAPDLLKSVESLRVAISHLTQELDLSGKNLRDQGTNPLADALRSTAVDAKALNSVLSDIVDAATVRLDAIRRPVGRTL
jgi:hypothetical protein